MPPPTLLHVFPTFRVGGAQVRFAQLANHFGTDYRHLVIAMDGATDCRSRLAEGLDVTFLPRPPHGRGLLSKLTRFRRLLAEVRPHLLVTSNWGSIEWAMANLDGQVRHLHMEDGFNPDEAVRQFKRRIWARRLLLRRSTVLLPSETLCTIARDVWRLPERRLVYVPNGIDWRRFDPGDRLELARSLGIARDVPVIGTVSTLRAEKNLTRLVDSFARVLAQRPAQLVIVGDGAERAAIEARATTLGIAGQVRLTGACATPEKLLPAFTLFALSSDTEQMPISILEAMAAGRPIAATDVGDVKRMLAPENRPYVVGKSADELAAAMLALLGDDGLLRALGEANRQRVRQVYDEAAMFAAYRRLFDGTLPARVGINGRQEVGPPRCAQ
jgi:glycosyltransferase involved in cell wall biosynthesis